MKNTIYGKNVSHSVRIESLRNRREFLEASIISRVIHQTSTPNDQQLEGERDRKQIQ
jgi:hypothetical protein